MTVTWGFDMSTHPASTGVVSLQWTPGSPAALTVHEVSRTRPVLAHLEQVLDNPDAVAAIDVPFGWPLEFAGFLHRHADGPTELPTPVGPSLWSSLATRLTDRFIRDVLGMTSLSVSFDKLGATAAMWAGIEHSLKADFGHHIDRTGMTGRFLETWPHAVWSRFLGRRENPARLAPEEFQSQLDGVVEFSCEVWVAYPPSRRHHVQDAIVCALAARARQVSRTLGPQTPLQDHHAAHEGWIHVPDENLRLTDLVHRDATAQHSQ